MSETMSEAVASGSFDDLRSLDMRFLEEASRLGPVHVLLWSDDLVESVLGKKPKFPQAERQYFLESIRYVTRVSLLEQIDSLEGLPVTVTEHEAKWVVDDTKVGIATASFCREQGLPVVVITSEDLAGFPAPQPADSEAAPSGRRKVIVTGCYDWFHTGHVRFFEEVSELGELHAVVGHDANIKMLKGEGHPLFNQDERRYMVGSIRFVEQAHIATGDGWLDAEPEIARIKPDIYAVNEDGDRPEKSKFCQQHGIEYRVLKRKPKPGLPKRQSTDLRGF